MLDNFKNEYSKELNFLKDEGKLVGEWENVYEHCFTEGLVASVISEALHFDSNDKNFLIKAALLHDWYKRVEREAAKKEGFEQYDKRAKGGAEQLRKFGYSDEIVVLTEAVGHTSLQHMRAEPTFLEKVMHYIDDITLGNGIVGVDERVDSNEAAERYKELNEAGRAIFGGRTYFEIQREVGHDIEQEIATRIGVNMEEVVPFIKNQLKSIYGIS